MASSSQTSISIINSLIAMAPDTVNAKSQSVREVLESFNIDASPAQNSTNLSALCRTALLNTLMFLNIYYYDRELREHNLKGEDKKSLGRIIHNRIITLLPKKCKTCQVDYNIPLNDVDREKRNYCFTCGQGSHICNQNKVNKINSDNLEPLWLCSQCMNRLVAPQIKLLDPKTPQGMPSDPENTLTDPSQNRQILPASASPTTTQVTSFPTPQPIHLPLTPLTLNQQYHLNPPYPPN